MTNFVIVLFLFMVGAFVPRANALVDSIEIIKHEHELRLIKDDKVTKIYTIALGRQAIGTKEHRSDKKTPVGRYEIVRKLVDTDYHKSLIISYPSPEEKANADALGIDIGDHLCIHGMRSYLWYLPSFLQKMHRWVDWTAGCIALTNDEIDEIFEEVQEGTPVVIYE